MQLNKRPWNFIDITGQKFGHWTAKYFNDETHKWVCECDCENHTIREISGTRLRKGITKSCGCDMHKPNGDMTSLIGQKFNKLTVVAFDHYDHAHKGYWKCLCECGNETVVQGHNLKSGHVKSCGCLHKMCQFEDISGNTYGLLYVDHFLYRKGLQSYYDCICKCGNHVIANANNLKRGHHYSCGCAKKSGAEKDIQAKFEVMFPDIEMQTNKKILKYGDGRYNNLEVDFYFPKYNLAIEYNGSLWHTSLNNPYSNNKAIDYHQTKFITAKNQGIHLISIFDVDWENEEDIILSYISDILNKHTFININDCVCNYVDIYDAKLFCKENSLFSINDNVTICYGVYCNSKLLSVIALKNIVNNKYELVAICTKLGITIIGGYEKLFSLFENTYAPSSIYMFLNNDFYCGKILSTLGFNYSNQLPIPYYWFNKQHKYDVSRLQQDYPEYYKQAIDNNVENIEDYILGDCLKACKVYRSGITEWVKIYKEQ